MLLGAFLVLLGAFWVLLGAFWVPLGTSWVPLGASWGDLKVPKGIQNGTKTGPKTDQNRKQILLSKKTSSRPSWNRLGTIWPRFGPPLGLNFIVFSNVLIGFRENSCF